MPPYVQTISHPCQPLPLNNDKEQEDFDRLITEHQHCLYVFIRSMIFNPSDARDVLQDVNMILIRKKARFELGTNFKAWACAIARFECLSYLNRYKKGQWATLDVGVLESMTDMSEGDSKDMKPWLVALRESLQTLSKESQQLIYMRYQQHASLDTIAERQRTSTSALKQKLYRIRNNLRKSILLHLEYTNH